MIINKEARILIQRHMKERYEWEMPEEEFTVMPYYEQVWEWWRALAYFQIDHSYERLEDAPDGLDWVSVMEESLKQYKWSRGEYHYMQEITKELCKEIYGK